MAHHAPSCGTGVTMLPCHVSGQQPHLSRIPLRLLNQQRGRGRQETSKLISSFHGTVHTDMLSRLDAVTELKPRVQATRDWMSKIPLDGPILLSDDPDACSIFTHHNIPSSSFQPLNAATFLKNSFTAGGMKTPYFFSSAIASRSKSSLSIFFLRC